MSVLKRFAGAAGTWMRQKATSLKRAVKTRRYSRKFMKLGKNLSFSPKTSYITYDKIEVGDNVFIGHTADFRGMITIGNDVMFGPYVYITDGRHDYEKVGLPIRSQGSVPKQRIYIDDDCWIGARSMIMRGIHIGEGTVVGGMSVVSRNLPPYCICVGSPCKPIKRRYSDEDLRRHFAIIGKSAEQAEEVIRQRNEAF